MTNEKLNTTILEKNSEGLPNLRFHDQTPISRPDNKRLCAVLSPCEESSPIIETMPAKIRETIGRPRQNTTPGIIDQLSTQLKDLEKK